MKIVPRRMLCFVIALAMFSFAVPSAYASPEVRRVAILSTMSEAALSAISLMQDHMGGEVTDFSWSATYSDRDWVFTGNGVVGGQKVSFRMSGYLWGEDNEPMSLTYSGLGNSEKEPIRLNGKADWLYDRAKSDYLAMDFRHVMKFGDNSFWGWVKGSEIIIGGTVGAGAAIATASIATGGLALGVAAWIGGGGAIAGSSALITVSDSVKSLRESHDPIPEPVQPARPVAPPRAEPIQPTKGKTYTAVSRNGIVRGSGPDGRCVLSGTFDDKNGTAKGNITAGGGSAPPIAPVIRLN